jgi:tRNA(Leu) C34 or U34 (ribose-2'-O)-methylase TrmL
MREPTTTTTTPAVVLIRPKYEHNVGAALRSCSCFGVPTLRWTDQRFPFTEAKGHRLCREERMKGYRDVDWRRDDYCLDAFPRGSAPVAVEITRGSMPIDDFVHPDEAVYVFGPEDGSLTRPVLVHCHYRIWIPSYHCLNLSTAVAIVLNDRAVKRRRLGLDPILTEPEMLREHRGPATPTMAAIGWD